MIQRHIACYRVAGFEIALARLDSAGLRKRPVAVAPSGSPRALLRDVSAEAFDEGLRAGMHIALAKRLCPRLRIVAPDVRRLQAGQAILENTVKRYSPVYESSRAGELFVDLTPAASQFTDAAGTAARIIDDIAGRFGIAGQIGCASNKLVSDAAANAGDHSRVIAVRPGAEKTFLAPLPLPSLPRIDRLFAPHQNKLLAALEELGMKRVGDLADVSLGQLQLVTGSKGRLLKQWAAGIDFSPIWPNAIRPRLSVAQVLPTAEFEDDVLLTLIYGLAERICSELFMHRRRCRKFALLMQYSDGVEVKRHAVLPLPSCSEAEVFPVLQRMFVSLDRRVRIRAIRLTAEHDERGLEQLTLFNGAQNAFEPMHKPVVKNPSEADWREPQHRIIEE